MDSLRERREAVVREHMESENEHHFDATLATFDHPATRSSRAATCTTAARR
jgi:hypothetical protein